MELGQKQPRPNVEKKIPRKKDIFDTLPDSDFDYLDLGNPEYNMELVQMLSGRLLDILPKVPNKNILKGNNLTSVSAEDLVTAKETARMIFRLSLLFSKRAIAPSGEHLQAFKRELARMLSQTGSPSFVASLHLQRDSR